MTIKRHTDPSNTLTTLTAAGQLTPDEFVEVVKAFEDDPPARKILWDCREAYPAESFNSACTREIAELAKATVGLRREGKTAFVAVSDVSFGMCRMYTSQLEVKGALHSMKVFRDMDEALKWLREEDG